MDRPLRLQRLRKMLRSFGVSEDPTRGKGSHTFFYKNFPGEGEFGYPVPTKDNPVKICYIKGCRRKFRLTPAHGVSDDDFYNA